MSSEEQDSALVKGRECGSCTLCCKVLDIVGVDSKRGEWCRHCTIGSGCGIYHQRPAECRSFHCGYRSWAQAGEHWFPARSNMVIVLDNSGQRLAIHVDPAHPDAWRRQPNYSDLKLWARLNAQVQIVVCIGDHHIVILPNEDFDLGPVGPGERVVTGQVIENGRPRLVAFKVPADDAHLRPGDPPQAPFP